jgi:hypothetical protein
LTASFATRSITSSYLNIISQSLVPARNNVYSLGSATRKWRDIYVSTASIYFDNYSLKVSIRNSVPQLLFNTSSTLVTVPSGSNPNTASYATRALTSSYSVRSLTASYALNTTVPGSNDQILTSNGSGGIAAESNLTFDGSKLSLLYQSGDEGGEILLNKAVTNTTLTGSGITIDSYRNKIRFFEQGGDARGAYIDLTACSAGVGTNLLSGGGGTSGTSGTSGGGGSSLRTGSLYPITSSWSSRAITASYALNASGGGGGSSGTSGTSGGGGSSLNTGSVYPITSSWANRAVTASYALSVYSIATLAGTAIDWNNSTVEKNITTSETYTFTNVATGSTVVVILNNTGASNVLPTFPTSVKWANSLYPTNILPNATSIYSFFRTKRNIVASSTENYL